MSALGPSITVLDGARVGVRGRAASAGAVPKATRASSSTRSALSPLSIAPVSLDEALIGLTSLEHQNCPQVALMGDTAAKFSGFAGTSPVLDGGSPQTRGGVRSATQNESTCSSSGSIREPRAPATVWS